MLVAVKKSLTLQFNLNWPWLLLIVWMLNPSLLPPCLSHSACWLHWCGISGNTKLSFSVSWRQGKNVGLSFQVSSGAWSLMCFRIYGVGSVCRRGRNHLCHRCNRSRFEHAGLKDPTAYSVSALVFTKLLILLSGPYKKLEKLEDTWVTVFFFFLKLQVPLFLSAHTEHSLFLCSEPALNSVLV